MGRYALMSQEDALYFEDLLMSNHEMEKEFECQMPSNDIIVRNCEREVLKRKTLNRHQRLDMAHGGAKKCQM